MANWHSTTNARQTSPLIIASRKPLTPPTVHPQHVHDRLKSRLGLALPIEENRVVRAAG
jgi:hypothetical protein